MKNEILAQLTAEVRGDVNRNEPLASHTSLRVGGVADLYIVPADLADLRTALRLLAENRASTLVVGGGYNLLVKDGGFRGAAISLKNFNSIEELPQARVSVGAGVTNATLVRFTREKGWAGMEFLAGIPGSIGGAVSMNAGAHGETVLDRLENITTLCDGVVEIRNKEALEYDYRYLKLAPGEIILFACFRLTEGSRTEIGSKIDRFFAHRQAVQQVSYPNAGSFFKNPEGKQAWRLIDEAGLRGYRIGGAEVSEVHSNFLVNRGGATASDFLELAGVIKAKVRELSGIELVEEVRIVGED